VLAWITSVMDKPPLAAAHSKNSVQRTLKINVNKEHLKLTA